MGLLSGGVVAQQVAWQEGLGRRGAGENGLRSRFWGRSGSIRRGNGLWARRRGRARAGTNALGVFVRGANGNGVCSRFRRGSGRPGTGTDSVRGLGLAPDGDGNGESRRRGRDVGAAVGSAMRLESTRVRRFWDGGGGEAARDAASRVRAGVRGGWRRARSGGGVDATQGGTSQD